MPAAEISLCLSFATVDAVTGSGGRDPATTERECVGRAGGRKKKLGQMVSTSTPDNRRGGTLAMTRIFFDHPASGPANHPKWATAAQSEGKPSGPSRLPLAVETTGVTRTEGTGSLRDLGAVRWS